jgi:hypothetical protein
MPRRQTGASGSRRSDRADVSEIDRGVEHRHPQRVRLARSGDGRADLGDQGVAVEISVEDGLGVAEQALEVEVEATYGAVFDVHRGEVAVAGQRQRVQLGGGRFDAMDGRHGDHPAMEVQEVVEVGSFRSRARHTPVRFIHSPSLGLRS